MKIFLQIVSLLNILKLCVSVEHIWHPYHHDPIHKSREELVITSITSVDFKLDYVVTKWESLHVEDTCFLAGITETKLIIVSFKVNSSKDGFEHKSFTLDFDFKPVDVALFQYWNVTSQETEAMAVVATQKPQLLWYKISSGGLLFCSWSMMKTIKHLNVFQIEYDYHLLVVEQYLHQTSASLYEFVPNNPTDFWLRQTLKLSDSTSSSAAITVGPDTFLAIPQKSRNSLQVYQFRNNHFVSFKNLTSHNISEVVAFKVGQKSFLAFNGLDAGIYRFSNKNLLKERVTESHLDDVNYWLPVSLTVYGDDTILLAQRSLNHGGHKSFVIEIFTYNGDKFEEHEDVKCDYFGEESLGLSCLPDEEAQGIWGSVSIYLGNVLGVVVPRKNRSSELFLLRKEIRKVFNPLKKQIEDFVARKQSLGVESKKMLMSFSFYALLQELMAIQEERYQRVVAREALEPMKVNAKLDNIEEDIKVMEEFLASERGSIRHFDVAVFNDVVTIESSGVFEEVRATKINSEPAEALLDDIVLKNNLKPIRGLKTFTTLEVDDLTSNKINDFASSDLLFNNNNITFNGNLFLNKPVIISNDLNVAELNGLVFEDEVIDLTSPIDNLTFESLEITGDVSAQNVNQRNLTMGVDGQHFEAFFIPRNLEVVNINGENFNEFLKDLCFTNVENYIPGNVKVTGDVKVLENAKVAIMNGLQFPGEYVFVDHSFPNITGTKTFTNTLTTTDFNCDGTIDDISPSNVITLTTDQEISGTTTFKNLKITESLQVDGNITGEHASKFLPNPTLLETSFVKSNVQFQNLEVQGAVIVVENFNNKNLELTLSDIVYTNEEKPVIEAIKRFPNGFTAGNLVVGSNSVNNVSLDSIVTKNTEQILNLRTIDGDVTFGSVETGGLYNFVDVKKFDEEVVKLVGEQYISSTFIFEDDVDTNKLEIIKSVRKLNSDLDNTNVNVKNIVVQGNFFGDIDGFDLEEFQQKRMSFKRDQTVSSNFFVDKSFVGNLRSGKINGIDENEFIPDTWLENLKTELMNGNLEIKDFHVGKSVEIDKINNKVCNFEGAFWTHDVKKHNMTQLTFKSDVSFDHVQIEKLSGVDFKKFVDNIVFKNETDVTITGRKTFIQGLNVTKLIETEKLNNVSLTNILTKHGKQEIVGPILISGDVFFENNVSVFENLNQMPVELLAKTYNVTNGQFKVTGDVLFKRLAHIRHLQIEGFVDDRKVQEVVEGIVYTDDDFQMRGLITFENKVNMDKNIRVNGKINSIDLPAFVSDMVMVTKDATIRSSVEFVEEVFVEKQITLQNNLTSGDFNGVDVRSWGNDAVFIDRGVLKGTYMFKDVTVVDTLLTEQINDINMQTLIPLRTQQIIPKLTFTEISLFKDVEVGNSVNLRILPQEFDNSVLVNTDQDIESDIEFEGNVFIDGDMELTGYFNGLKTESVVTTNTEQQLEAVYNFKSKVNLEKDLLVQGLVNGIDVNQWANRVVKTSSQNPQNITDNWIVNDLVFEEDCIGDALINNVDFQKFSEEIVEKRQYKYEIERGFIEDYTNICKDLKFMHDKMQNQIYKFDYLENLQILNFQHKIDYVYSYEYQSHAYLIVNEKKNCQSHLFIFDGRFRFVKDVHFGHVAQIISVRSGDSLFLVVRNHDFYSSCKVQGSHVWEVDEKSGLVNREIFEEQELLQDSVKPRTFYGLRNHVITEFKISPNLDVLVSKYRKWRVNEENIAFVPRGLATGLALRTGRKLIKLRGEIPVTDDFSIETEEIIIGNYTEEFNTYFPGRNGGDLVVMKAGIRSNKRNLLAVASHEETSVKGSLDFIKIYEDATTGKVFHKVASYKPSSLVSLEFHNGETLLAFMEDASILQIYEYKGIEGFKHKSSVKLPGSEILTFTLNKERNIIGVVDRKKITFMEVVMLGNQIDVNLQCSLYK